MHIQHLFTRKRGTAKVIKHICYCPILMAYLFLAENATSISLL